MQTYKNPTTSPLVIENSLRIHIHVTQKEAKAFFYESNNMTSVQSHRSRTEMITNLKDNSAAPIPAVPHCMTTTHRLLHNA